MRLTFWHIFGTVFVMKLFIDILMFLQ